MSPRLNDCPICGEVFPADLGDCPFCEDDSPRGLKYRNDDE